MPKRTRKRSPSLRPAPPLSRLDKGIYLLLSVLALGVAFSPLVASLLLADRVAFSDPTVIASASRGRAGLWLILSLLLSGIPLFTVLAYGMASRQPFFGRRDTLYGHKGGRVDVHPLLRKRDKPLKPAQKRAVALVAAMIAVGILAPIPLSVWSVYGRYDLHGDLSVTTRNGWNAETERAEVEEIETVTFSIERYRGRRYSVIPRLAVVVTLRMKDGRRYAFTPDAETLLYVKSQISPERIRYELEDSVENYVSRYVRDPMEAERLREVFGEA